MDPSIRAGRLGLPFAFCSAGGDQKDPNDPILPRVRALAKNLLNAPFHSLVDVLPVTNAQNQDTFAFKFQDDPIVSNP